MTRDSATALQITTSDTKRTAQRNPAGPSDTWFGTCLFKTVQGFCLVVVNIKHRKQLRDHQQILNLLSQVEQLQLPTAAIDGRIVRDQFADPPRIDVTHTLEVEQDLRISGG